MARVRFRRCWPVVGSVAILCCVVLMAGTASHQHFLWVWPCPPVAPSDRVSQPTAAPTPTGDTNQEEIFPCSANQNLSVPPQLPPPLQEFLRYRHCRAFPSLLTPSPCARDLYLLLVVKSTAAQVERRDAVRDTWGRAGQLQGQKVKLVFLLGRSRDLVHGHKLQPQLEWESRRYGDILQWDFTDDFYNLTRKEIGFLSWFARKCSAAQFVFKGDDDVFANTDNLLGFLRAHRPEEQLFTGFVHGHGGPSRDARSKYFIPVEIYSNESYPPFPSGGGYLMSRQTVLGLNTAAQKMPLYPLDDVFVAFCLQEMGLRPAHHDGFLTFGFDRLWKQHDPCAYRGVMVLHQLSPADMRVMWVLMKDRGLTCATAQ